MSPTTKPFSPLLIWSSVLALSALIAATVFSSMALASDAVPCANAVVENKTAVAPSAPIRSLRNMDIPPYSSGNAPFGGQIGPIKSVGNEKSYACRQHPCCPLVAPGVRHSPSRQLQSEYKAPSPLTTQVGSWPLASFRGDVIIQSLSEPSGHRTAS